MKKITSTLALCFTLAACGGGSTETTREPKGNPNAAVAVWEFADLQCPACRAAHTQISGPLVEKYGNDIAFHHKHFPLRSIHRYALDVAMASECAADQGKFWEYIDAAFKNQEDMSDDTIISWGTDLGVDTATFERCVNSNEKRSVVLADYEQGRDLGVGGTPVFFVNGQRVDTGFDTLSAAIDAELARLTQQL